MFILNAIILTYGAMFISCIYYLIYSQLILSEKYKVAATSLHAQEEIEVLERQHDEWKESWISRGKRKRDRKSNVHKK